MIGIHKMMSTLKSFTDYQKWWSSPKMMTVRKTMQTPKSFWEKRCTSSKMMSLFKNDQFALSVQHTFLGGGLYYLLLFAKLWLRCMQVCGYITERERTSQVTTLSFTQGIPPSVISTPQFTWRGYHQARDLRGGFRICPLGRFCPKLFKRATTCLWWTMFSFLESESIQRGSHHSIGVVRVAIV